MKDWNRIQFEKQKAGALKPTIKGEPEKKESGYPANYYPGKWVSIEEAQQIERYDMEHRPTGEPSNHWVNRHGEHIAFSY